LLGRLRHNGGFRQISSRLGDLRQFLFEQLGRFGVSAAAFILRNID
jgi:hypothetical protein